MMDIEKKQTVKAEFHCHTTYSFDSRIELIDLIKKAREININRLAITDHNTIEGAKIAKNLAPDLIILGEEVRTLEGEIIGLFLKKEIPGFLSAFDTLHLMREQGAFIIIPHPFDFLRSSSWNLENLLKVQSLIDAIEVYNSRCIIPKANCDAKKFSIKNNIPQIVGSDAHQLNEIGKSTVLLDYFNDPETLREVLPKSQIKTSRIRPINQFLHRVSLLLS